jgi:hypothetical protein
MMKHRFSIAFRIIILSAAILVAATGVCLGDFIDFEAGTRPTGMGGAFVAIGGDVTSVAWNPACLATTSRLEVMGMASSVYGGVEDLSENFVAASARLPGSKHAIALGWIRTGLKDIYSEDTIILSYARSAVIDSLYAGVSLRFLGLSAPGYDYYNDPNFEESDWKTTGDVGLQYRRGAWAFGTSVTSITAPELQLISTTEDPDEARRVIRVGAAYFLQRSLWLSMELRHHNSPDYYDRNYSYHAGAEAWFHNVLILRGGLDDGRVTAGAGLVVSKLQVDVSLLTHRRLGNTYRLSLLLKI